MAIADELIALLGFELTGEGAAKRYEATLQRIERTAERVGNAIGTGMKIAAAAGAAAFGFLGKSIIDTNAQFEQYQATLETIEGSADKARESLAWISGFGKTTPYDVAQVTEAFVKLKAYGIDPIADNALRTLGDTASAMGKDLNAAVEMFADASGMEFERLKEFGIRATQEGDNVTFHWTKNGVELTETMKKSATEVRAFLLETLGDRFAGAMDRQSRTFNGMVSNIGDSWTDFQRRVGASGFFEKVNDQLEGVIATLARLDADGTLDKWAAGIGSALSISLDMFTAFATRVGENVLFIIENWDKLQPVAIALAGVFAMLFAKAFPVAFVFGLIALAVDDFLAYLQGGESVIGRFIERIQNIIPVSDEVAAAIGGLAAAVGVGLVAAFTLKPFTVVGIAVRMVAAIATAIAPLLVVGLTGLSTAVMTGMSAAFALLSNPIGWGVILAGVAAALIIFFWDDLVTAWNTISAQATTLFNQLGDWLEAVDLIGSAGKLITDFWGAIVAAWTGLQEQATALFAQMGEWFLSIDWGAIGSQMMTAIFDGMKAIGENIKTWFAGLFVMPDWVKDLGSFINGGPEAVAQPAPPPEAGGQPGPAVNPNFAPVGLDQDAWDYKMELQRQEWESMLNNAGENIARMAPDTAVDATITDARSDARSFPMTVNTTVNQTVTQPTSAPSQAANATASAVQGAVTTQRSQIETEPSF